MTKCKYLILVILAIVLTGYADAQQALNSFVHTYGFKPFPDVYFTEVENGPFGDNGAIAYGGGRFVIVSAYGKIAYSNILR